MPRRILILSAVLLFWSVLIGASWHFLPLPLAVASAAVHALGLVLTATPLINLFLDQTRTRSPQTGIEASRPTLPGSGYTFAAHNKGTGHCPPDYGFSLGGGGRDLPAARTEMSEHQALEEAGFTVVSLSAPWRGE